MPPSYGSNATTANERANSCGIGNCTQAMLNWGKLTWEWCNADPRIHGILPWHYQNYPVKNYEIGAKYMPAILSMWQQYGKQIVSNKY